MVSYVGSIVISYIHVESPTQIDISVDPLNHLSLVSDVVKMPTSMYHSANYTFS